MGWNWDGVTTNWEGTSFLCFLGIKPLDFMGFYWISGHVEPPTYMFVALRLLIEPIVFKQTQPFFASYHLVI